MKIYCRMETGIGKKNIEDRVVVDNSIIAGGVYSADIPKMQPFVVAYTALQNQLDRRN